jgi:hypothetical protein
MRTQEHTLRGTKRLSTVSIRTPVLVRVPREHSSEHHVRQIRRVRWEQKAVRAFSL